MDARERTPPEDAASFVSGMQFGLLALRGRLKRLEDPAPADVEALIEDIQREARRIREDNT